MTNSPGMTMNGMMILALQRFQQLRLGEVRKIYPLEASSPETGYYDSVLFGIEYYRNPDDFDSDEKCEMDVWFEGFQIRAELRNEVEA